MSKYNISNIKDEDLVAQYFLQREVFSDIKEQSEQFIIYKIKEEFGSGRIEFFTLKEGLMLVIYDVLFNRDMITSFNMSSDYFEIEYCISGSMEINEESLGHTKFIEGEMSVSLSKDMNGEVIYRKDKPYKGISIAGDKRKIDSYFGSQGLNLWFDTIEELEESSRSDYYLGRKVAPDISNVFLEIYKNKMDYNSKILFLEAKIMEIFSRIISFEKLGENNSLDLDLYEIEKIKLIPSMLMERIDDPPTIEELSSILAINKNRLNDGFKEIYHDTIFSYHRTKLLEKSKFDLENTSKNITEISFDTGYSSPSNYTYAFKRKYSLTPKEYRLQFKNK
ncbi:MAG: AraC family transcriptional regulator [Peptostreptococcus sp.]|uniref:helix-turn-helix domain-containing protein n=1 Tax=Peptostreptococcus sp. TaxID=1262 RepID=UPI002FC5CA8B